MNPEMLQQAFELGRASQRLENDWYTGEYPYMREDFEAQMDAIQTALKNLMFQSLFTEVHNEHQ
jgi:hypothetical protein